MSRPFRFAVVISNAPSCAAFVTLARRAEELGYATLLMPDRTITGLAPLTALAVAAESTTSLRVGSCRAPHVWLERAGQRLSTLDLFGMSFVLLAGRTGAAWCQAATEVAHARRLPLHAFTVGPQEDLVDPDGSWARTYAVEQDGAVLVRPDGHVAWRCRGRVTHPGQVLQGMLASVLGEDEAFAITDMHPTKHCQSLRPV